jgi:ABC-type Mn2+/Zn2+ transport system ATPase subunit
MAKLGGDGLEVSQLRAGYGSQLVLEDVSLRVGRGQIVGLIGPNGSGKSTLLKTIVGLVPRLRGSISIDDQPIDRAALARIAYVPQRSEVDWTFPITVEEVVLLGRQGRLGLFGRPSSADRETARRALEKVEMHEHRHCQIGELSGGQQQRVFLARALAQEGEVLLLDEPLTGVDVQTQTIVLELLERLRRERQAILMATHDLAQAADICDQLYLLRGRVVASGRPDEVLQPEPLAAAYGGGLLRWQHGGALNGLIVAGGGAGSVEPSRAESAGRA